MGPVLEGALVLGVSLPECLLSGSFPLQGFRFISPVGNTLICIYSTSPCGALPEQRDRDWVSLWHGHPHYLGHMTRADWQKGREREKELGRVCCFIPVKALERDQLVQSVIIKVLCVSVYTSTRIPWIRDLFSKWQATGNTFFLFSLPSHLRREE